MRRKFLRFTTWVYQKVIYRHIFLRLDPEIAHNMTIVMLGWINDKNCIINFIHWLFQTPKPDDIPDKYSWCISEHRCPGIHYNGKLIIHDFPAYGHRDEVCLYDLRKWSRSKYHYYVRHHD